MPDTIVYKSGYLVRAVNDGPEAPSGPGKSYQFVMSTEARDSYGDIVKQNWNLAQFRKNPIGLWRHSTDCPIGSWAKVGVVNGVLQGTFTFAAPGTTECVDEVANLVDQQVVRMVSVGFRSKKATPIDPENPWDGYILDDNTLVECSIVPIGACDEALMQRHIKTANALVRKALLPQSGDAHEPGSVYAQLHLKSQASDTKPKSTPTGRKPMASLAEKIQAKQQEIVRVKDQIAAITNSLDDTGAMTDEQSDALHDLSVKLESLNGHLKNLEHVERTVAATGGTAAVSGQASADPVPRVEVRSRTPGHLKASNALACIIKGLCTHQNPMDLVRSEFAGTDVTEMEMLVRAATAPATVANAAWAGNLVQETWGPLVELMYALTFYGRLPGMRVNFEGKLNLPTQNGRGALAGDFIAENGAWPVKIGSIGSTSLQPHLVGVISAFTKALMRRSVPSIQGIIQNQILKDTAETIDAKFLDAVARTAGTRPAGLRDSTETGAANINAASGSGAGAATVAQVLSDTRALLGRVWAVKGQGGVWLMNPGQRLALEDKQDGTTGQFPFRDEIQAGKFRGYPIIESTNVTPTVTAFIADDSIVFGTELLPYFEQSDQATLHFEDTTPTSLSAVGTPNTVAAPVVSLFQQDLVAVKSGWTLDWRITRAGGVQVLTGTDKW